MDGLIRHLNVESGAVRVGVDGYARDLRFTQRPDDADRDLTSIGDEDFFEEAHGQGETQ